METIVLEDTASELERLGAEVLHTYYTHALIRADGEVINQLMDLDANTLPGRR